MANTRHNEAVTMQTNEFPKLSEVVTFNSWRVLGLVTGPWRRGPHKTDLI